MNQDEQRSRLIIQTENTQREIKPSPREASKGIPLTVVIGIVLCAMMLTAIVILVLINRSDKTTGDRSATNANINLNTQPTMTATPLAAFTPTTNIAPTATPQPTIQPAIAPTVQPASIPLNTPTPNATAAATPNLPDDATLQANVSKVLLDDTEMANADIDTNVARGKVTLRGKVKSANLKLRAEKLVKTIRGVQSIDDKITVEEDKSGWSQTTAPDNSNANAPTKP